MGERRKTYRCFLKSAEGRTAGVQEIKAASDAEAKERCLDLLRAGVHRAGELWEQDRHVASIAVA